LFFLTLVASVLTAGKKYISKLRLIYNVSGVPFPLSLSQETKKKIYRNVACLHACAPRWSLNGWTNSVHVRVFKSFADINYSSVNMRVSAPNVWTLGLNSPPPPKAILYINDDKFKKNSTIYIENRPKCNCTGIIFTKITLV
jgi:hypothetical protein